MVRCLQISVVNPTKSALHMMMKHGSEKSTVEDTKSELIHQLPENEINHSLSQGIYDIRLSSLGVQNHVQSNREGKQSCLGHSN